MGNSSVPKDIMPTLVLGLGGTGFQIIKRLKKLFEKRYGGKNMPIRYLIIDTDLKSFLDDDIDNNEKCQLRFNEGVKTTLDWAYKNPSFEWLPQNPQITPDFFTSTDQGAGLMRPIGRMYLCKNAKLVYDTLIAAKNDLVDLYKILTDVGEDYLENIDRHKVYVVGSLAGGTGCGTFLDVSVMLSKVFNRDNTNIIGMFTLESCYDDKLASDLDAQNRSKANCYAALKELEFYMSSIEKPEDEKYTFKYTNLGDIRLEKKLLDICYIIENKNEIGGVLTNIDDIYDLCSLQLFQEIGTKLGSQLRADYANFICKDKDPVLNRDRHFSTFSSSSMEVPIESLKRYCRYKLCNDILLKISSKNNYIDINEESGKLGEQINDLLNIEDYLYDFTSSKKLTSKKYSKVKNSLVSLSNVKKQIEDEIERWNVEKEKNWENLKKLINKYVNENAIKYGLDNLSETLRTVNSNFINVYKEYLDAEPADEGKIKSNFKQIKDRKVIKDKKDIPMENFNEFNNYIEASYKKLCREILKQKSNMFDEIIRDELSKIQIVKGRVNRYIQNISGKLNKINYQAEKKYGGNIISREMISKEFYLDYYTEKHGNKLHENINAILKEINILEILKNDNEELIKICKKEVEETDSNIDIMDILAKNAIMKEMSIGDYVKDEIEITAKLAKPFWSAIKNPEVSWTECYYIGSIKDDNITNGFTIKPHEPIDNWIRSQTGERSRQARYVETTNPYSIDVIHITMGACGGYLPDVKHYKQFYFKLLSSQAYPLHLNQSYIGLNELDNEAEELLKYYSLAHCYGVILKVHGEYLWNLTHDKDGFSYIFNSIKCLDIEDDKENRNTIPINKGAIDESLILGDKSKEILDELNSNIRLRTLIKEFIRYADCKFTKEYLTSHKKKYIELREDEENYASICDNIDFIAREKLRFEVSLE